MAGLNHAPLIVLLGPTASGKSMLSMSIAKQVGAEILSVDSMQVYRHMDIGTAKPSPPERVAVRHHAIDLIDPTEGFTVAKYVALADEVIRDANQRQVPLIVTGGTPLYYKALFEGLFDGPEADQGVRERLRLSSNSELHLRLTEVDPIAAARIHQPDSKRLIRALEVYELTGRPISSFQNEWSTRAVRHRAIWFGLNWDRDQLNRRINARVKLMIADGWLEETRTLLERYGSFGGTAGEATGYQELARHLAGDMTLEDALERIKILTRQLARRQMKWFRRFPDVNWLPGELPIQTLTDDVMRRIAHNTVNSQESS